MHPPCLCGRLDGLPTWAVYLHSTLASPCYLEKSLSPTHFRVLGVLQAHDDDITSLGLAHLPTLFHTASTSSPTLQVLGVVHAHNDVVTFLALSTALPFPIAFHPFPPHLFRFWAWCRHMTTSSRPSPSTPTAARCSALRGTAYCGCGTRPHLAVRDQARVRTARQALCQPSWVCSRGSQG